MIKFGKILILIILFNTSLFSQFFDDFSDGDFRTNPEWNGDVADFIVNGQYQLQLDAAEGGTSKIYAKYYSVDSLEWNFYFKMDFSPSNSNKLKIFLMLDSLQIEKASGLYLEIGENGNDDKIKLYELKKGENNLLGTGTGGEFSNTPAESYIRIQRFYDGVISVDVKNQDDYYKNELQVFSDVIIKDSAYFMLECDYTSTRKDKFFFDDISIKKYEKDLKPPQIISSQVLSDNSVSLTFDEPLLEESLFNKNNYIITNNNKSPTKIEYKDSIPNNIKLTFDFDFQSGTIYILEIKGLKDLNDNIISQSQYTRFYLTDHPEPGDIVVNEILFNPFTNGSDFLELINISSKFIDLNGIVFKNYLKDNNEEILEHQLILNPGNYICITEDTSDIIRDYFVPDTAFMVENDLPSFDNDTGNVTIGFYNFSTGLFEVIDSFDYSENMHSQFITNDDGISLERKNPLGNTNDKFNWGSASTLIGGATPGYKNSGFYTYNSEIKDNFSIANNIFSPDFDGVDDNLVIEYAFDKPENLTNIY
ncbi:MAG TPA: hypothetical protein ENK91_07590, partial [Bacteroidetes bacterium]|nr:hypothetical protein [Bacteroidota bacterium]